MQRCNKSPMQDHTREESQLSRTRTARNILRVGSNAAIPRNLSIPSENSPSDKRRGLVIPCQPRSRRSLPSGGIATSGTWVALQERKKSLSKKSLAHSLGAFQT
ncbi:hypothetical protein COCVIDRAFT_17330 [Bipolaris victoriae FI3]|uniref:Uncharacterized protein n=1 Tax=Bipolaris victoriae (strain FI3) TaxID=930091 RepID=W7E4W8_BIPV3|nr:hypothetical protein COCVIDRAFT_17330 [Bipolaris victoriae FI3]